MAKTSTITRETLYFKVPTFIVDVAVLCGLFCLALYAIIPALPNYNPENYEQLSDLSGPFFLILISFGVAVGVLGINVHERNLSASKAWFSALWLTLLACVIFIIAVALAYKDVPRKLFIAQGLMASFVVPFLHLAIRAAIRRFRKAGRNTRQVVIVGMDANAQELKNEMALGGEFSGYFVHGLFGPEDAVAYIRDHSFEIDEVYCSMSAGIPQELMNSIILACEKGCISFWYIPDMNGYLQRRMTFSEFGRVTVMRLREEPMGNMLARAVKRLLDILISGLFLCTLYPLIWVFVAIGIKISSPGPILFRQKRTGYSGKSFNCLKFRSMKVNAESGTRQATADDPRKTRFGNFLRRSSLDELPQFINVLKGDMSIVGPRPHMEHQTEVYSELFSDYMVRHLVRPGITGWAQVSGCRGETKTDAQMKARVEHDIWYIEHWSLALDVEIFFKTIAQVVKGDKQAY